MTPDEPGCAVCGPIENLTYKDKNDRAQKLYSTDSIERKEHQHCPRCNTILFSGADRCYHCMKEI